MEISQYFACLTAGLTKQMSCGLVAEGFVGFWRGGGLWLAPWVVVSVGPFGWRRSWSGCCEGLGLSLSCGFRWVVLFAGAGGFGFGLGLRFGVARVLLVGQPVPDQ